jgi:hypothetical protein
VAALLLFMALSLVLTYPLAFHLAGAVEDPQDALLNVWITAWDGHQLLSDPLHLFDANIFHPYPRTLAYSELLLGNGLLALPLTAVSGNPVLGYNLALLLSFVLSGFGTYLLALKLARSPGAGLVAGVIFAYSSYQMSNIAQAQLLTTQWLPLALLSLVNLMRRPRGRHVVLFVLFFCLQALSSFYYGLLLAIAVVSYVLWALAVRLLGDRQPAAAAWPVLGHLALAALCCALIIVPFTLPYVQVQRDLNFERTLADNEPFSASLRQYVMVPPNSLLHARWLPSDDTPIAGGYPVDALFPGLVAIGLALWGVLRGRGRTRWFFALLLPVAFVLSLGPRLYLAPGQPAGLDASLPYAWLYAIVPGFKALRAPVRFDALVMLSLAVLAGYAVATFRSAWAPVLLAGLVVVEFWVWPAAQAEPVPVADQVPAVYRWLAQEPAAPILELPLAFTPGGPQLEYQYLSTYHWHTTPDGYSGFVPPKHGQIVYEVERFPSERSVSLLQGLGVRYAILHQDRYSPQQWTEMQAALEQTTDLERVEALGADWVYQVQSRTFDPGDLAIDGYFPSTAAAGETYTAYLIVLNQDNRSYAVQPTDTIHAQAEWQAPGVRLTERISADMPLVTSPDGGASVVPLPLSAPAGAGPYTLSLDGAGGPLGAWSIAATIEVGQQGAATGFPVPVRLEAWSVPDTARAGNTLAVDLTWRALGKIDAYYSTYVKLLDKDSQAVAGWDGQPRDGQAPTLLWVPGQTIDDTIVLDIPADLSPGDYAVEAGMYRATDLARCLTLDAGGAPLERLILGAVHIEP